MWDLIGLGIDVLSATRQTKQASQIQNELNHWRREYPEDYPIFDDFYSLYAANYLQQGILPVEDAESVRLVVATTNRGLLDKPFRCISSVNPIAKSAFVRYISHVIVPPAYVDAAFRYINHVNLFITSGSLFLHEWEDEAGKEGYTFSYQVAIDYSKTGRPVKKLLENMLKDAFVMADSVTPALYEIASGKPVSDAVARLNRSWNRGPNAPDASRQTLLGALKKTFQENDWNFEETSDGNGFKVESSEWDSKYFHYYARVSQKNDVYFEIQFNQQIPQEMVASILPYSYMLNSKVHVNEKRGIVFVKEGLNLRGCENKVHPPLLTTIIEGCVYTDAMSLIGVKYLFEGLDPPHAFYQGLLDYFGDSPSGLVPPNYKEVAKSMAELVTGYSFDAPEEEKTYQVPEQVEPETEIQDYVAPIVEEPAQPTTSMSIPTDIRDSTVGLNKIETEQRQIFRKFVAAEKKRSEHEAELLQKYDNLQDRAQQEAAKELKETRESVERISNAYDQAKKKLSYHSSVPSLPAKTAVVERPVSEPTRELEALGEKVQEAGRALDKALRDLVDLRSRLQRQLFIRLTLILLGAGACLAYLTIPFIFGLYGARAILFIVPELLQRLGVTAPWAHNLLPEIVLGVTIILAAIVIFLLTGTLFGWKGYVGKRLYPLGEIFLRIPNRFLQGRTLPRLPQRKTSSEPDMLPDKTDVMEAEFREVETEPIPIDPPGEEAPIPVQMDEFEHAELMSEQPMRDPESVADVMFCMECGKELGPEDAFCMHCGAKRFQVT